MTDTTFPVTGNTHSLNLLLRAEQNTMRRVGFHIHEMLAEHLRILSGIVRAARRNASLWGFSLLPKKMLDM